MEISSGSAMAGDCGMEDKNQRFTATPQLEVSHVQISQSGATRCEQTLGMAGKLPSPKAYGIPKEYDFQQSKVYPQRRRPSSEHCTNPPVEDLGSKVLDSNPINKKRMGTTHSSVTYPGHGPTCT